jgi:ketosteroid isomerase-like protein
MVASTTADATRALGRDLIDTFGKGWQKGSVETMMSVFAGQAVFFDSPFAAALTGSEQIEGYWKDVPAHQAEVTFTSGEIYAAGPWFSTEFKVTYRRRRTGEWVEARGALFCETDGEKVTEMRMYWTRG